MEVDEQASGVPPGWEVVEAAKAPEPSKGRDFKLLGVNIHIPAEEKPRLDSNMVGFSEGGGVAPEDALMVGMGAKKVGQAVSSGTIAAVKEAIAQAAPWMKYEVAHQVLRTAGVPEVVAVPLAGALSMYKGGAKGAGPVNPDAPHMDRSVPVKAGDLSSQQLRERILSGTGTPQPRQPVTAARPMPGSVPEPPVTETAVAPPASEPTLRLVPPASKGPSPTALSSDAALAARRELYQASQTQGWTQMEYGQALKLRAQGVPNAEIIKQIEAARLSPAEALANRLGTPSDAEMTLDMRQRYERGQKSLSGYGKQ